MTQPPQPPQPPERVEPEAPAAVCKCGHPTVNHKHGWDKCLVLQCSCSFYRPVVDPAEAPCAAPAPAQEAAQPPATLEGISSANDPLMAAAVMRATVAAMEAEVAPAAEPRGRYARKEFADLYNRIADLEAELAQARARAEQAEDAGTVPPKLAAAVDEVFKLATNALNWHEKNRTPQAWQTRFDAIFQALAPHASKQAWDDAQRDHEDGLYDAASY